MNETRLQKNDKASKLGSATIAVHQSEVPPADHGQELAEAAPLEANAPMEAWQMAVANHRQDWGSQCKPTQAQNDVPQ